MDLDAQEGNLPNLDSSPPQQTDRISDAEAQMADVSGDSEKEKVCNK